MEAQSQRNLWEEIGDWLKSPFLLAVRLYWGYNFFITGLGKYGDIHKVGDYFHSLGIPFPTVNAYIAGGIEIIGGLCLMLGLFSRTASLLLVAVMAVAFLTAESDAVRTLLSDPNDFVSRPPFNFLLASLIVFIFGPGKISLDYLFRSRFHSSGK